MGSAMVLLLLIMVCGFSSVTCDRYSEAFTLDRSIANMTTYISTENSVNHMEMDQYHYGSILFSDWNALKSTDSKKTQTVAGEATKFGYLEGRGEAARFHNIPGFYQISKKKVVVVDEVNNCLRLVDRLTGQTKTFSGTCTKEGYAEGSQALFDNPRSIIPDSRNREKLLLTDTSNRAVRHVDIRTGVASTFYRDTQKLAVLVAITQDVCSGDIFMTVFMAVYKLHYQTKELTLLAGDGPAQLQYRDGDFSVSLFDFLKELLLIDEGRKLMVADGNNNRLRVLDMELNMTDSICTGSSGHTDGGMNSCSLAGAKSLAIIGGYLYIGGYGVIRRVSDREQTTYIPTSTAIPKTSLAITSTTIPTTTTTILPCPPSLILRKLDPGHRTVDVEISPGQSLELPAGDYIYKLNSEQSNCTVSISITEGATTFETPITTPATRRCDDQNITVYTDPSTGTALVELGEGYIINLSEGTHTYQSPGSHHQTCVTTFIVINNVTDVPAHTLTCPEKTPALTAPDTSLATFQLKFGDQDHILQLPQGRYPYIIKSAYQMCNTTLIAEDYRVRRTLEFEADYTVDCTVVNSPVASNLLEDVAKQSYSIIKTLCGTVCNNPGVNVHPIISCDGTDELKIRWPTDLVFTADIVSVPANIRQTLEERVKMRGPTLNVVVFGATPPVVYPKKTANGGYVSIGLSTTCINGLTYSKMEDKCV